MVNLTIWKLVPKNLSRFAILLQLNRNNSFLLMKRLLEGMVQYKKDILLLVQNCLYQNDSLESLPQVYQQSFHLLEYKTSIKGSFNTERFIQFLTNDNIPKDSVVLLDNVAFHRSKIVLQCAKDLGIHLLFVPPYSPWFNPIEGVFSIVKRAYYKDYSIDKAFDTVSERHCNAFFQKSLSLKDRL